MELPNIIFMSVMYLNCFFEMYLLYDFLVDIFPVYDERKQVRFLETIGCVSVMFIVNRFNSPLINVISVPVIFLLYVWIIFRLQKKYTILYVLFYYVLMAVTEFAFHYVYKILGIDVTTVDITRIIFLTIQNISRFMIIQAIKKQQQATYQDGNYRYLKRLFILPITALVLINGFLFPPQSTTAYVLICIGGILMVVSNVVDFSTVQAVLKATNEARDAEQFMMKTLLEQHHYQRLEEINQDYAKYIHEVKRLVQIMEQLSKGSENKEIRKLTEQLEAKGTPAKKRIYSGDQIINAIFIEREKASEKEGISYSVDIQPGIDFSFIEEIDKISMFGNLLDNALEAASASEEKYVTADLYMGNDALLIFRVKNSFKTKPMKKGQEYLTSKLMEKEHGFGIKLVRDLSHKYNGLLNLAEDKNIFVAMLFLSKADI